MKFLFDNFDILAESPEGIKKLREMILQFAVQGKLVPQDPNDEPASVLLAKIRIEKELLVKEGKIKKQKPLEPIKADEIPFELPEGWELSRLQEVIDVRDGTHDSPKDAIGKDTYPLITSKNFYNGTIKFDEARQISAEDHNNISKRSFVEPYDILFSMIGGNLGNQVMVFDKLPFSIKNVALFKYYDRKLTSPFFIKKFMEHLALDLQSKAAGGAQPFVSLGFLRKLIIAIPPIEEQKRIVAKVDFLMVLCDELEKQQKEKALKKLSLNKASLHTLHNSTTKQDFNKNWSHITKNFDLLYSTPENVKELKQTILQLAVQGKLVSQDPNDEPASVLLEKIRVEKERLVKEGKIKKQKPLEPIKESEIPFELPEGWEWCRLDDLCTHITDGTHHTPTYIEKGIPFLSVKNLSSGFMDFSDTRFISEEEHSELIKRCNPKKNDVLLTKVGTTGIAVTVETDRAFSIFVSVALLKIVSELLSSKYITRLINSPLVKKYSKEGTEGVGNKNLVLRKIKSFILPLPPLAEQKRIVARVDSLMALCDRLGENLSDKEEMSGKMLSAVVSQL